jgi:hypothetical protein
LVQVSLGTYYTSYSGKLSSKASLETDLLLALKSFFISSGGLSDEAELISPSTAAAIAEFSFSPSENQAKNVQTTTSATDTVLHTIAYIGQRHNTHNQDIS